MTSKFSGTRADMWEWVGLDFSNMTDEEKQKVREVHEQYFDFYNWRSGGANYVWIMDKTQKATLRFFLVPEPKTLITVAREFDYRGLHPLRFRSLVNFKEDSGDISHDAYENIDRLDMVYTERMGWKLITNGFLDHVYGEYGYVLEH